MNNENDQSYLENRQENHSQADLNNKCDVCKSIAIIFKGCLSCEVKSCFDCIQKMLTYSVITNNGLNPSFFEENSNIPFFCFNCKYKQWINTKEIQNISKDHERKFQTVFCDYCGENEAKHVCMDCGSISGKMIKICKGCRQSTHKKQLKNHGIIDFDQNLLCLCKENNICTKLCQDCSMILCQECTEKKHKNHILKNLDDQFKQTIQRKKEQMFSIIENKKNEIFSNDYEANIKQEEKQMDLIIKELKNHIIIVQESIKKIEEKKTRGDTIRSFYENLKNNLDIAVFENFPIQLKYFLTQKLDSTKLDLDFQSLEFKPNEQKINKIIEEVNDLSKRINSIVESFSAFEIKTFKLGVKVNDKEFEFFKKFSEIIPDIKIERPVKFKFNQEKVLCVLDIEENNQKSKALVFGVDVEGKKCSYLEIHKLSGGKKKIKKNDIKIEKLEPIESHVENIRLINKFENFLYTCAEEIHVYPDINHLDNFKPEKRKIFKHLGIHECIRSVHMLRDRTKELVENIRSDENIYLLFSLDNNSSVFLINYKDKRMCKEFKNEGKLCTSLDSFYDEKEKKLYLILGYQLSFIEVWEFVSTSSFNLIARYSSENFCLNSIKIESLQGRFYFYFGFGNGAKKIGKISKYEFKKQIEKENQLPITEFEIKDNQIFATEIIEDNLIAATQEYLYRFNKHNFEEGFTKSTKFKDAKISDVVHIKEKDIGELVATISFQEKMVKLYKLQLN